VHVVASAPGPIRSGFAERADLTMSLSLEPEVVARLTLRALGRRRTVRPGWLSKLLGGSLALLPCWVPGEGDHPGDGGHDRAPARHPRHGGECATLRRGTVHCHGAW